MVVYVNNLIKTCGMGNFKELVTTSVFERDTVTHEYTQMDEINMG